MNLMRRTSLALGIVAMSAGLAHAQQGVSKGEIVVGTIQDLSGPIAAFGKQARNGMQLRVEEINEQGGINGRKIKLIVEDNAYDPRKAVLSAQKLVNQDKVFAVLGHIGTAHNNAAMPIQFEKNVINWLPITAAREMYEPYHKMKFSFAATYYDQMRVRGAEWALKSMNMDFAEKTSFKRGSTDFSSQVARMKSANCDLVVMGTIIRETIGTIGESRKTGFSPIFFGSSALYTDLIHKLGGKAMDGLYGMHTAANPYLDDADEKVRFWANKYKTKFSEDPTVFSAYGYSIVDMFALAVRAAGPTLTPDSFVKAAEATAFPPDMFGSPPMKFKSNFRLGNDQSRMSQITNGRWAKVTDYLPVPPEKK